MSESFAEFIASSDRALTNELVLDTIVRPGALTFGPLRLGMAAAEIEALGAVEWEKDSLEEGWDEWRAESYGEDGLRDHKLRLVLHEGALVHAEYRLFFNVDNELPEFGAPALLERATTAHGQPKNTSKGTAASWLVDDVRFSVGSDEGDDERHHRMVVVELIDETIKEQEQRERSVKRF